MRPIVVVETRPFQRFAADIWSDAERQEFIDAIAREPIRGAVMQGTGGVRKLRWSREGIGKSGGVRVIYYFHDEEAPLFLLTIYPKGPEGQSERCGAECDQAGGDGAEAADSAGT